jgi:hypothetical protein
VRGVPASGTTGHLTTATVCQLSSSSRVKRELCWDAITILNTCCDMLRVLACGTGTVALAGNPSPLIVSVLGLYEGPGPDLPMQLGIVTHRPLHGTLHDYMRTYCRDSVVPASVRGSAPRRCMRMSGLEVMAIALQVAQALNLLNNVSHNLLCGS